MDVYSTMLSEKPDIITKDMVDEIKSISNVDDKYAYYVLLCSILGLDIDTKEGREIGDKYILSSLNKLDVNRYYDYPFFKDIDFTQVMCDNWELKYEYLKPYELFVYNDIYMT